MYDFCKLMKDSYNFDPREVGEYSKPKARALLKKIEPAYDGDIQGIERTVDYLWKKIRKDIINPGFLINVPVYLEPLAKRAEKDSRIVERFQVIIAGSEMGKGFSEFNDPIDQRARFTEQQKLRDAGDEEAQMANMDFVEALEYGMPPAFGFGVAERFFSFPLDLDVIK